MSTSLDPRLLRGLATYQDVMLGGEVAVPGTRDCAARWELVGPCLAGSRAVLDVGSNFGWFGLAACGENANCVVASVEADERSAAVQRSVLQSHDQRRICLLTRRAGVKMAERFEAAGQRFDAALCLSVLHWLSDHREFISALGRVSARIIVEHPHPDEMHAGIDRVRDEIGEVGSYLRALYPGRAVTMLGETMSHLHPELPRQIWMVDRPHSWVAAPAAGLDAAALLDLSVSWPPRHWWQAGVDAAGRARSGERLLFTAEGLAWTDGPAEAGLARIQRRINSLPEKAVLNRRDWLRRRARRVAAAVLSSVPRAYRATIQPNSHQ